MSINYNDEKATYIFPDIKTEEGSYIVRFISPDQEDFNLVLTYQGETVYKREIHARKGVNRIQFKMSKLIPGLYDLSLLSLEKNNSRKVKVA